MRKQYLSQKGFTLIEAMVAVAISAVIIMAFLGMFNGILKTQKYVTQRYEIQDLSALVRLGMMQSNFCSCNFPTALDFSSGTVPVSTLKYFDPATCATSTGLLVSSVAPNDNVVPGSTTGLRVKQMQMQNMQLLSSPTPATNYYSFDMQIDFDPTTTAIQVKPVIISGLTMITDATAAPMQKISSCATSALGGSSLTATQLCLMLGGVFVPSGSCSFPTIPGNVVGGSSSPGSGSATTGSTTPTAGASPTPVGTPPGTVVASCYTAEASGVVKCSGGAAPPSTCPSGTVVSDYYAVSGITTQFNCKIPVPN